METQNDFLAGKITTYKELNEALKPCRVKFSKKDVQAEVPADQFVEDSTTASSTASPYEA